MWKKIDLRLVRRVLWLTDGRDVQAALEALLWEAPQDQKPQQQQQQREGEDAEEGAEAEAADAGLSMEEGKETEDTQPEGACNLAPRQTELHLHFAVAVDSSKQLP